MDTKKEDQKWFKERNDLWPGSALSLEFTDILYKAKSKFQEIMVLETKSHGRALVLDGIIQCTERDEFAYHEMITHLPISCHKNPRNVLIIGGGDGGVAREVAKHDRVESIVMVEVDKQVVEVCKTYLKSTASGLDHPKFSLRIEDGIDYVRNHPNEYDVIITDSSDPVGPAVCLFEEEYFELLKKSLRKGGIICNQMGSLWLDYGRIQQTMKSAKKSFSSVEYASTAVPTYPSGQIGFLLASDEDEVQFSKPVKTYTSEEVKEMNLKYYNSRIHEASFVHPTFASNILDENR